ncbi:MAG: PDZ domain-containing protein [Alphaproteobacteria bacterium]|nr:PDZ domain-containing protein [Alphaproteobacteria bacterium]
MADVRPNTPAATVGIKAGDVIVAIDGKPLLDSGEVRNAIGEQGPGTRVTVSVLHDGRPRDVNVTLQPLEVAANPQDAPAPGSGQGKLGLGLAPIPNGDPHQGKIKGAYVGQVQPGSLADASGIQQGDIITDLGRAPVSSPDQAAQLLKNRPKDKPLLVRVWRGDNALYLTVD